MRLFQKKPVHYDTTDLPLYRRRLPFLSDNQRALWRALHQVAGREFAVLARVKLFDLVESDGPGENRNYQLHWIKVHQQSVDFLLCRARDMEPLLAIRQVTAAESARRSFSGPDVVDSVLRDIGLPQLHVKPRDRYDPLGLKKKIVLMLSTETRSKPAADTSAGTVKDVA